MENDIEKLKRRHAAIHDLAIKTAQEWAETTKAVGGLTIATMPREKLLKKLFRNYRLGRGLRLTRFGFDILGKKFETFTDIVDAPTLAGRARVFLDHNAKLPYYISEKKEEIEFSTFERQMAFIFRLCDRDLSIFIDQYV